MKLSRNISSEDARSSDQEFVDRIRLLLDSSLPVVLPGHFLSATALAVGLTIIVPAASVWVPWTAVVAWAIVRTLHILWARGRIDSVDRARHHALLFATLVVCLATTWGIWGYLSMDPRYPLAVALVTIITAGIVSGGVGSLAPCFPVFVAYAAFISLPPILRLLLMGDPVYTIVGILSSILLAMNTYASWTHGQKIRETIHLRYRIGELVQGLKRRAADAERANAAKTRFLSAASHDLRHPLQAIRLYANLLEGELDNPGSKALHRIKEAAAITTESLDQVLDLSQLETGVMVPHASRVDLHFIMQRMETMFLPIAVSRGIRFRIRSMHAVVTTDPRLLERILQNLVANALRYTPDGGCVLLCVRRRAGKWCIEVRDNGIGIAPDKRDLIFDEFRQIEKPSRERDAGVISRPGLGLGLSIVRRIVTLLEHDLEVMSKPDAGSTFRLLMNDAELGAPGMPSPSRDCLAGYCFLFVDDDPFYREVIPNSLKAWGGEVEIADTLQGAGKRLDERFFDVLICDQCLGNEDCAALLRRSEWTGPGGPFCIILADDAGETGISEVAGNWPILRKPLDLIELVRLLDRTLNTPAAEGRSRDAGQRGGMLQDG